MLNWLIIGGGIHGTHVAHVLQQRGGVPRDRVAILDPHPTLLARWSRLTEAVEMDYLRSPNVHHIGLTPDDLDRFARSPQGSYLRSYRDPYHRPAYLLFQAHAMHVVHTYRLDSCLRQGQAHKLIRLRTGWRVETDQGALEARCVLLAIGRTEAAWPAWARSLQAQGANVHHCFDPTFHRNTLQTWQRVLVVGGGITAAQIALALAQRRPGTVTLLSRHPLRRAHFDSPSCWNGPKCMTKFTHTRDYRKRRALIQDARHRGTMPHDVGRSLDECLASGAMNLVINEAVAAQCEADGTIVLRLERDTTLWGDCLVLATGFERTRPGGGWLEQAIVTHDLPTAPCGYPIVDSTLCWTPGLYTCGPLAELELGPVAPNISGARRAAERLLHVR